MTDNKTIPYQALGSKSGMLNYSNIAETRNRMVILEFLYSDVFIISLQK